MKNCVPCQKPRQSASLSGFQWASVIVLLVGLALAAIFLWGCAAAQTPDGRIVIGWDAARLADTPEQILDAGADFLPPPFNYLASALIAGGGVGYLSRRARKLTDAAFDEGVQRAAAGTVASSPTPPPVTPAVPA